MEANHFFICPYCWQKISVILDLSVAAQEYIEDCEVCCRPIQISFKCNDLELVSFSTESIEQ